MPQVAPVVILDNTATEHTFQPLNVANGVAQFVKHSVQGEPAKDSRLDVGIRVQANGARRVNGKVQLPIIRSVDGVDQVIDYIIVEVTGRMPSSSTLTEREQATSLMAASLDDSFIKGVFNDLSGPY